jgi:hypothetical protein
MQKRRPPCPMVVKVCEIHRIFKHQDYRQNWECTKKLKQEMEEGRVKNVILLLFYGGIDNKANNKHGAYWGMTKGGVYELCTLGDDECFLFSADRWSSSFREGRS